MPLETTPKSSIFARRVTGLFLVLSIQLLLYVFYCSEIVSHGLRYDVYLKYYLVCLSSTIFWAWVFRLTDEIKLNIILVTTSLVMGIYLIEFYFYFFGSVLVDHSVSTEVRSAAAKAVGKKYNTQTKRQVYLSLKDNGLDVVPSVHPSELFLNTNGISVGDSLHPLGGISEKTTIYCNEKGNYAIFKSDRYGFNNPNSEWDSTQIDWVLTGDSFAQGACVNPGEEIAGQIRSITKESVVNLGIGGNGLLSELAVLKEYAELIKPKKVLWVYYEGNDLLDLEREKSASLLMSYLKPKFSQNLIHRQTEIDKMLSHYITQAETDTEKLDLRTKFTNVRQFFKIFKLINIRQRMGLDLTVGPLFKEILKEARDRTESWGGKLFFVYLPNYSRYKAEINNSDTYMKRRLVIDTVNSLNIPVIDVHKNVFEGHPDPLSLFPFRQFGHYTSEANTKIANAIILNVS